MDWDKLRVFYHIARVGKFVEAGKQLNIAQPSLSRTIRILEEQIGAKLFTRTAQGLILTDEGEALFKVVSRMFSDLETTTLMIQEKNHEPQGPLSIITTTDYTLSWFSPYILTFLERYPRMEVSLICSEEENGFDLKHPQVALRPFVGNQPGLIQNYLLNLELGLYAPASTIAQAASVRSLNDLADYRFLFLGDRQGRPFNSIHRCLQSEALAGQSIKPYLCLPSLHALLFMLRKGGSIAVLTHGYAQNQPDLVRVLPEFKFPPIELYYIYPALFKSSKRILALGDYIKEIIG